MIGLALGLLIAWPAAVFYLLTKYPVQKAVVISFVSAWLFLPPIEIALSGIPDWSKSTATAISVLLALIVLYPNKIFSLRFRWFDLPVTVFSGASLISAISSGVGVYEGLSSVLDDLVRWCFPYLIGRACLANRAGALAICQGIVIGGLCYMPLCLFEIRMSPVLKLLVYGITQSNFVEFGFRYGGYRPSVFLTSGLELGWWMCCSSFCAYCLWASGATKRIFGYPMATLSICLALVTLACKSTGAITLIGVGLLITSVSRRSKTSFLLWLLLLVGPAYSFARPAGLCSGDQILYYVNQIFPADRTQSLEFRFDQEEILMRAARQRPWFGWTRNGGFNPMINGRPSAVIDGFWIIVFCSTGGVGLVALNAMLLLPTAVFLVRYRPQTWLNPDVAPLTAMAVILPLFMIDNLGNAMPNPIYAIAMGSLSGCLHARRDAGASTSGSSSLAQLDDDGLQPAPGTGRPENSESSDAIDSPLEAESDLDFDAADRRYRDQITQLTGQNAWVRRQPRVVDRLAGLHASYARLLASHSHHDRAVAERSAAADLWASIRSDLSLLGPASRELAACNANDLAWLLVLRPSSPRDQVDRGVRLAEEALQHDSERSSFWNTLGIAFYRQASYLKAIQALSRSVTSNPDGGTAFDFYYLALANDALGYSRLAHDWLLRAEAWADTHPRMALVLHPLQLEASALRVKPAPE